MHLCVPGCWAGFFAYEKVIGYMEKNLSDQYKRREELSLPDCDMIFQHSTTFHAAERMGNFVNLFCYNFSAFADKRIFDLVMELNHINYEFRKKDNLPIKMTYDWNKNLLNIPYYSHHHVMKYDAKKRELCETKSFILLMKLRNALKHTVLFEPLNRIGHNIKGRRNYRTGQNQDILKKCLEVFESSPSLKDPDFTLLYPKDDTGFVLAGLANMTAIVKVVDLLKE